MVSQATPNVYGTDGLIGTLVGGPPAGGGQVVIQLTSGGRAVVRADALAPRIDGGYHLAISAADLRARAAATEPGRTVGDGGMALAAGQEATIPVIEEQVTVGKRVREAGKVVVHIEPREREQLVDVPVAEEHVDVERVAVNRFVDGPVAVREEGDVTIIPVIEEVLVVERRLMLKEEVRITKRRETKRYQERVTLRTEEVHVLRADETGKTSPEA